MHPDFLERGKLYNFKDSKSPIKFLYCCPWAKASHPRYVFKGVRRGMISLSLNSVQRKVFEIYHSDE